MLLRRFLAQGTGHTSARLGTQQELNGQVLFCRLRRALDTRLHAMALTSELAKRE